MLVSSALLTIDIHSNWCIPDRGKLADGIDVALLKEKDGLPFLPSVHLKGLIREAAEQLTILGIANWTEEQINLLFGGTARVGENERAVASKRHTMSACVIYGDAFIVRNVAGTALNDNGTSTRIVRWVSVDRRCGDAGALCLIEFAMPLTLQAYLIWRPTEGGIAPENDQKVTAYGSCWHEKIAECLPYVTAVGWGRRLGYGRATFRIAGVSAFRSRS